MRLFVELRVDQEGVPYIGGWSRSPIEAPPRHSTVVEVDAAVGYDRVSLRGRQDIVDAIAPGANADADRCFMLYPVELDQSV